MGLKQSCEAAHLMSLPTGKTKKVQNFLERNFFKIP